MSPWWRVTQTRLMSGQVMSGDATCNPTWQPAPHFWNNVSYMFYGLKKKWFSIMAALDLFLFQSIYFSVKSNILSFTDVFHSCCLTSPRSGLLSAFVVKQHELSMPLYFHFDWPFISQLAFPFLKGPNNYVQDSKKVNPSHPLYLDPPENVPKSHIWPEITKMTR